jgi:hypothetical protein
MQPRAAAPLGYALPRAAVSLDMASFWPFRTAPACITDECCSVHLLKRSYSSYITRIIARRYSDRFRPSRKMILDHSQPGRCAHAAKALGWHARTDQVNKYQDKLYSSEQLCVHMTWLAPESHILTVMWLGYAVLIYWAIDPTRLETRSLV